MAEDTSNKTEKATPEKLKKARKEGQFARSKDAGAVGATVGVLLVLAAVGERFIDRLSEYARWCFAHSHELGGGKQTLLRDQTLLTLAMLVVPVAFAAATVSSVLGFAQAGWKPEVSLFSPQWNRLNPLPKLQSMFGSVHTLVELAMSVARLGVVAVVAYLTLEQALPAISRLAYTDLRHAVSELVSTSALLTFRATVALAVLAALDYVQSKLRLDKQLMMSQKEVRDEMKQQEGDPHIKGRLRQRMRQLSKNALMSQVAKADVLVTNPTHIAIALQYSSANPAPVMLARGYDEQALFMRSVARAAGVPIIENRGLARSLASRLRPGQFVPVDLYSAVAEVLAFVYRLRRKRTESGPR